jgi:hypothetical protein
MLDVVDEAKESKLFLGGSSFRESAHGGDLDEELGSHSPIRGVFTPVGISRMSSMAGS